MPLRLGARSYAALVLIDAKKNDFIAHDNNRNLPAPPCWDPGLRRSKSQLLNDCDGVLLRLPASRIRAPLRTPRVQIEL